MKDLIKQIEALKLKDDRNGLKQNAVIDKVLEIIKKRLSDNEQKYPQTDRTALL